jgi:hypothetical protein
LFVGTQIGRLNEITPIVSFLPGFQAYAFVGCTQK